jgi:thioredoxin reductase (NADPH)
LLAEVGVDSSRMPVVVFYDGTVLVDPAPAEVWQMLGVKTQVDVESCDVVVVGAGPAGLAAAVYAASEGLETLVLEPAVPGGQAGTSSLIRNYLGFHRGVSGGRTSQSRGRAGVVVWDELRAVPGGNAAGCPGADAGGDD